MSESIYLGIKQTEDGDFTFYDVVSGREVAHMISFEVEMGGYRAAKAKIEFNLSQLQDGKPVRYAWWGEPDEEELEKEIDLLQQELEIIRRNNEESQPT